MEEELIEAKTRFYNNLADLLELMHTKIEDNDLWINLSIEKLENDHST